MDSLELENLPDNFKRLLDPNGGFYILVKIDNKTRKVISKCKFCPNKTITAALQASSNLITHLRVTHPVEHKRFVLLKEEKTARSLKRKSDVESPKEGTQETLDVFKVGETKGYELKFQSLLAQFLVSTLSPISLVEDPAFKALIKFLQPDVVIPQRQAMRNVILSLHGESTQIIRKYLKAVDYVCLTVDCWSSKKRRYFGMTAHWLNADLTRKSAVLSLCRFKGEHNSDAVAELLCSAMKNFDIGIGNVVSVVTDNGSNFVKAFKDYGIESEAIDLHFDEEEEELVHESIAEILDDAVDSTSVKLPPHTRCVAHTLNLVASQDPLKISDKRLMHTAFGKCSALWTRSSSPKASETINDIVGEGLSIVRPVVTRWNSKFDAVSRLLDNKEKLDEICEVLNLPKFRPAEVDFLIEYKLAMAPIASALDVLQGQEDVFAGDILPELLRIEKNLMKPEVQECKWAKLLAERIIQGIKNRFGWLLEFQPIAKPYILASMSHPFFKTRWIPGDKLEYCRELFLEEAIKMNTRLETPKEDVECVEKQSKKAKRFEFDENPMPISSETVCPLRLRNTIQAECFKYYGDASMELNVLEKFPFVKIMFRRYNTQIPSSAPVERLFSYAGMIMRPKRNRMNDDLFEALATLKCNSLT